MLQVQLEASGSLKRMTRRKPGHSHCGVAEGGMGPRVRVVVSQSSRGRNPAAGGCGSCPYRGGRDAPQRVSGYGPFMANEGAFEAFSARIDEPVFVVTVAHGRTRAGCLIGFGSQVSIDPARFLACLSDKNRTYRVAAAGAEHLAVHLVPAGRRDLAELFGGETGDDVDKFERCAWHEGPRGVPLL